MHARTALGPTQPPSDVLSLVVAHFDITGPTTNDRSKLHTHLVTMASSSSCCRKPDIVFHDDLKYCQSCGDLHDHDSETFDLACSTARVTNPFKVDNIPKQSSPYVYAPLEHGYFRLVELQPGEFESEMVCEIFHARIAEASYNAMSYRL